LLFNLKNLFMIIYVFKKHEIFLKTMKIVEFYLIIWSELEPEPEFLTSWSRSRTKIGPAPQHCEWVPLAASSRLIRKRGGLRKRKIGTVVPDFIRVSVHAGWGSGWHTLQNRYRYSMSSKRLYRGRYIYLSLYGCLQGIGYWRDPPIPLTRIQSSPHLSYGDILTKSVWDYCFKVLTIVSAKTEVH
jgi:hypothetical protein